MRFRSTGILALVFIALLAFVYFYEIKGGEEREREAAEAKRVLSVSPDSVNRIAIDRLDTLLVMERQGGSWRIVSPVETDGIDGSIDVLAVSAGELEKEGVAADGESLASGESALSDFGLDPAGLTVALTRPSGTDTLWFGDTSPTGRYVYFRWSGSPDVLLAQASRRTNFEKSLFDLREKLVMSVDMDAVTRIRIERGAPGGPVEVALVDGAWRLTRPVDDRADPDEVDRLLNRLRNVRARSFASETADDLRSFGLAAPARRVTVLEGDAEKSILIGDTHQVPAGTRYYAKYDAATKIVSLDSLQVANLLKSATDLRDKNVFAFDAPADSITQVTIAYSDSVVTALRADDGVDWILDGSETHRVVEASVMSVIREMKSLKASGFAAEAPDDLGRFGLDRPDMALRLSDTGGEVLSLKLARSGDTLYALREGRPQVYEVKASLGDRLKLDLIEYGPPDAAGETGAQTTGEE